MPTPDHHRPIHRMFKFDGIFDKTLAPVIGVIGIIVVVVVGACTCMCGMWVIGGALFVAAWLFTCTCMFYMWGIGGALFIASLPFRCCCGLFAMLFGKRAPLKVLKEGSCGALEHVSPTCSCPRLA